MRESRSSGSVEGVMGNHDSYSDSSVNSDSGTQLRLDVSKRAARSCPGASWTPSCDRVAFLENRLPDNTPRPFQTQGGAALEAQLTPLHEGSGRAAGD